MQSRRNAMLRIGLALTASPVVEEAAAVNAQQPWPTRSLRLVMPYSAGGPLDVSARILAEHLSEEIGQAVVVENVPGAASKIGMIQVARARDGHTVILNNTTACVVINVLDPAPGFDLLRDFRPIVAVSTLPLFLVVNSSLPVSSAREFVKYAKANSTVLSYASFGIGSPQHVLTELFLERIGVRVVHVPYKGDAPAMQALLSNEVQMMFRVVTDASSKDSRLRALGVAAARRLPAFPTVPTLTEQGIEDVVFQPLNGIFAPSSMPDAAVKTLNAAVNRALKDERVKSRLEGLGYTAVGGESEALLLRVESDFARFRGMLARGQLKVQ